MILLVNFGGPRTETEIPSFLRNLMAREPAPAVIEGAVGRYRAIGGCSPLPAVTEELACLIAPSFGPDTAVRAVFMYSHPLIEEVIEECRLSGMEELVFFILSPYYSTRITGVCIRSVQDCLSRQGAYKPAAMFVHSWCTEPLFIDWWTHEVRRAAESRPEAFFLFSAHSLPVSRADGPYRCQIEDTVRLVARKTGLLSYDLAWQSAPPQSQEEWMGPSVEQVLDSLAQKQVSRVIQTPIGFIMDHLETLYDIDIAHKRHAEALGISHQRLSCPNTAPLFVKALSTILSDRLKGTQ